MSRLTAVEKRFLQALASMNPARENFTYAGVAAHSGLPYDDGLIAIEDRLARKGVLPRGVTSRSREQMRWAA